MVVFHAFLAPYKCDDNSFAYAAIMFYSLCLDEGKEQRLVAASCVFPRNVMFSSPPSFLTYNYRCVSRHSCMSQAHAHFG